MSDCESDLNTSYVITMKICQGIAYNQVSVCASAICASDPYIYTFQKRGRQHLAPLYWSLGAETSERIKTQATIQHVRAWSRVCNKFSSVLLSFPSYWNCNTCTCRTSEIMCDQAANHNKKLYTASCNMLSVRGCSSNCQLKNTSTVTQPMRAWSNCKPKKSFFAHSLPTGLVIFFNYLRDYIQTSFMIEYNSSQFLWTKLVL